LCSEEFSAAALEAGIVDYLRNVLVHADTRNVRTLRRNVAGALSNLATANGDFRRDVGGVSHLNVAVDEVANAAFSVECIDITTWSLQRVSTTPSLMVCNRTHDRCI
jgi:hypothetical protein